MYAVCDWVNNKTGPVPDWSGARSYAAVLHRADLDFDAFDDHFHVFQHDCQVVAAG